MVKPVGKPRMTRSDVWKQRPAVMKYRQFCDELRAAMPDYELPGAIELTFYLAMPKSWSKKVRLERAGLPHDQKPDIDNLCKAFMDAFKSEDKHVYKLHAEKYWAEVDSIDVVEKALEAA